MCMCLKTRASAHPSRYGFGNAERRTSWWTPSTTMRFFGLLRSPGEAGVEFLVFAAAAKNDSTRKPDASTRTRTFTHSFACAPARSLARSFVGVLARSFVRSLARSFTRLLAHSLARSPAR